MRDRYVTQRMFGFQMWYLRFAGFSVVSLGEILDFVRGNKSVGKMVAITFDDGYQDFYDNAWPVLKKYGYLSAVFLVPGLIGGENIWDRDKLVVRKKLLNNDSIMELKAGQVTFGPHTRSRPFLTKLSEMELVDEIGNSKSDLEEKLSAPVEFFCYPKEAVARKWKKR